MNQIHVNSRKSNKAPERAAITPTSANHRFTLRAIMELQKSTGHLTSSVGSLQKSIDKQDARFDKQDAKFDKFQETVQNRFEKQDTKLDKIQETVSGIGNKVYKATAILTIVVAIGTFVITKYWGLIVS